MRLTQYVKRIALRNFITEYKRNPICFQTNEKRTNDTRNTTFVENNQGNTNDFEINHQNKSNR